MSFKVIDGGGSNKEERDRQREQEWAGGDFSSALRECAANVLCGSGSRKTVRVSHSNARGSQEGD
jgi:hypothetical protein